MRFTVNQKKLSTELDLLKSIATRKTKEKTSPAASGILVKAEDSKIILSATDKIISLTTLCPAEPMAVFDDGSIILPASRFCDIIKEFDNLPIDFELSENDRMRITCGRSVYNLAGQKAEDFPTVPHVDEYSSSLPISTLIGQITRTEFAIPEESNTGNAPKGAMLNVQKNILSLFAIDGTQMPLVKSNITFPDNIAAPIPGTSIVELMRLLNEVKDGTDGLVWMSSNDNHIFFKAGDRELSSLLLTTQFPNPESLLSKTKVNKNLIKLNCNLFARLLKRVVTMSDQKSPSVLLDINKGEMKITSSSADIGDGSEPMEIESDVQMQIVFDSRYLLPCLNAMKTEKVQMEINNAESPVLLRPIGEENFEYVVFLMPKRLI